MDARPGNTSACAEKRHRLRSRNCRLRKYLRVRGEEADAQDQVAKATEIPPRARRRAKKPMPPTRMIGNTSACAEKSHIPGNRYVLSEKYLRVRGEERSEPCKLALYKEIPPRARRRAGGMGGSALPSGNTSACAEKRSWARSPPAFLRKYLRVRGEEGYLQELEAADVEIPPRARRRVICTAWEPDSVGNTSACAEKSQRTRPPRRKYRKYLRVRGEEP